MKERTDTPSAPEAEPQKRQKWPLADQMKAVLERAIAHQPQPIALEGAPDDDDDADTE